MTILNVDLGLTKLNSLGKEERWNGYIAIENEKYSYEDETLGNISVKFFKGVMEGEKRLLLGYIKKMPNLSVMLFWKVEDDCEKVPCIFELTSKDDKTFEGVKYSGTSYLPSKDKIKLSVAREVDGKERERVKKLFKISFDNIENLPSNMQYAVKEFKENKKMVIENIKNRNLNDVGFIKD